MVDDGQNPSRRDVIQSSGVAIGSLSLTDTVSLQELLSTEPVAEATLVESTVEFETPDEFSGPIAHSDKLHRYRHYKDESALVIPDAMNKNLRKKFLQLFKQKNIVKSGNTLSGPNTTDGGNKVKYVPVRISENRTSTTRLRVRNQINIPRVVTQRVGTDTISVRFNGSKKQLSPEERYVEKADNLSKKVKPDKQNSSGENKSKITVIPKLEVTNHGRVEVYQEINQ